MSPMHQIDFNFKNALVGYFEISALPEVESEFTYMPYRGLGHLHFFEECKSRNKAKVSFEFENVEYQAIFSTTSQNHLKVISITHHVSSHN